MDNQTTELLSKLAEKLGTTSEYLFGVLVRQAPISSSILLFNYALLVVAGVVLYRTHLRLLIKGIYEDEGYRLLMVLGVLLWSVLVLLALCYVENMIAGFFNPEYWALDKILSSVRP